MILKTNDKRHAFKRFCIQFMICFTLLQPFYAASQTTNNFSGWLGIFTTTRLSDKFSLHLEANLRSTNQLQQIQNFIFRPGLNYKITKKSTVTLGYAYVTHLRSINGVSGWGPEDRIFEQFSNVQGFVLNSHFITMQNRFRLEQRFISQSVVEGDKLVTSDYNFIQRIRYFFRFIVPLSKTGDQGFKKGMFVSLQNEVFFNIGNTSVVNGKVFDQNRAYFSLGNRFSPDVDIEAGYMNQFVLNSGTAKTNNNIIQLAAYLKF